MPVFDDPNRELRRLQEQLLAEEEDDFDELLKEYIDEDDTQFLTEELENTNEQEPVYRNFSNGYGVGVRNFANGYRGEALLQDEDYDAYDDGYDEDAEPYAVFREEKRGLFGHRKAVQEPKSEAKGIWKLKVILLLEIIGILCILIWWVMMLW